MTTAKDFTFGCEFEITLPAGTVVAGGYHRGLQVQWLPAGWNAQTDGSISTGGVRGVVGVEIVSPILKGEAGLDQVVEVIAKLTEKGAKVNASCGFHVHVGSFGATAENITKITSIVACFEKAIFASTGTKARETGRWCGSVARHGNAANAINQAKDNRYHVLNLKNVAINNTIEFRAFGGTLNAVKVAGYIQMCLGLVEKAITTAKVPNFVPRQIKETSKMVKSGEGQTALTRLFSRLGWGSDRSKKIVGRIGSANTPSLKSIKKELMRLAAKYDGVQEAATVSIQDAIDQL